MSRNGLSKEKVVKAAVALIEQSGMAEFSMRALADSLQIKTASLYNHVESMEYLLQQLNAKGDAVMRKSLFRDREYDSLLDNAGVLIVKYKQDMWKRLLFT